MIVSTSTKVPTDDCFSRPINRRLRLIAVLQWVQDKESKLNYSTHFLEFVVIYVCVLRCKSKVFWSIVAMIVMIKQDDNFFKTLALDFRIYILPSFSCLIYYSLSPYNDVSEYILYMLYIYKHALHFIVFCKQK